MSTIKSNYLQNPSASSPNITLGSTGSVAINGSMTGAGMDLITTQSFTAVSSVSINNCFSSAYVNYLLLISATATSTSAIPIQMRLRSGGVDDSAANYNNHEVYTNNSGGPTRVYTTGATSLNLGFTSDGPGGFSQVNISSPFLQAQTFTNAMAQAWGSVSNAANTEWSRHGLANSYDGMTLLVGSGTFTGTFRVYGYKNS